MAKINTELSLTDNVSPGLEKIRESAQSTSNGFSKVASTLLSVNSAMQIFSTVSNQFKKISASVDECVSAYQYQNEQELKLSTIMRQRMGASEADIQSIKDLASAQQQVGIYGDEIILQGAQELASFTSSKEAIETLIPAMNNLIAQQYGYSASGQQFQSTADMMGKVLSGQTGALSRMGYIFSEQEEQLLKTGTEMQKASALAKIITENVGNMNQALRGTDAGRVQDLNNYIGDLKENIGATLQTFKSTMSTFKSTITVDFLNTINNLAQKVIPIINRIIKAFTEIYTRVRPYIQLISDFIINVLGKAINFIIDNLHSIATFITVLAGIMVAKTAIMAASWAVANWQIVLAVGLIFAIIKAMSALGISVQSIGGVIGGILGGAFVVVYNIVADIYNLFVSIGELIANITKDPVAALLNAFADICAFIADALGTASELIDLVGKVLGKDWNISGKFLDAAKEIRSHKIDIDGGYKGNRMEKKTKDDLVNSILNGAEYGKNLGAGVDNGLQLIKDAIHGVEDEPAIQDAIQGSFKINADGTVAVEDKGLIDIADDYRELLSKQATERFNLRFSQVTPRVTFGDINMNNAEDSESVLSNFVDRLSEAASSYLGR